jgi:tetratricopeptide (TPR) repeat protein
MALPVTALCAMFASAQASNQESGQDWMRLNAEGNQFYNAGNFVSAELRFRSALLNAETFGDADPRYWATLSNLGLALERRGDLAGAETALRRVATLRERGLGAEDPSTVHALLNVAVVLHLTRRDAEADPILRNALSHAENSGNQHLTAEVLNALSLTLMDEGELARAEPVMRRAIAMFEQLQGEHSIEAAKATNNLAMVYVGEHEFGKAEAALRLAIPRYEYNLGESHPELIGVLNNMFTVLGAQKRFDEGEPYLRRALALAERESSETLRVIQLRSNLGALELHRGNYKEAASIFKTVIEKTEKTFGADDPQLAGPLSAYAEALNHLHQRAEAKRAGERAHSLKSSFMPR